MLIASLYNCIVTISTFIYCDDFIVLISEILSSSILLYMFYRFQMIAYSLLEEKPETLARLEYMKATSDYTSSKVPVFAGNEE